MFGKTGKKYAKIECSKVQDQAAVDIGDTAVDSDTSADATASFENTEATEL